MMILIRYRAIIVIFNKKYSFVTMYQKLVLHLLDRKISKLLC